MPPLAMRLAAEELLPGEDRRGDFPCSYYVAVKDWGLKPLNRSPFSGLFGVKGLEAVGGSLHLTQWRLIFTCHGVNRFKGAFEIPLADITTAENVSAGVKRAVRVSTAKQAYEFNMWGIPKFLTALEIQRRAFDEVALDHYRLLTGEHGPLKDRFGLRVR